MVDANLAQRNAFFTDYRPAMIRAYQSAQAMGWEVPVVLLLQNTDETAAWVAEQFAAARQDWQAVCDQHELPSGQDELPENDDSGIVFGMTYDSALEQFEAHQPNVLMFLERGREMQLQVDALHQLALFLIISHGFIDCKLHPLQPRSPDAGV